MASPKIFTFTVYDPVTGLPKSGAVGSLSFTTYKDETGANVTPPAIASIGGGGYYFTPVFATDHGIYFEIGTGSNLPLAITGYLRPEDYAVDSISDILIDTGSLRDHTEGTWIIPATGPDANRIVFYGRTGAVVDKFDLKHDDNTPWSPSPGANTKRVKV